MEEVQQNLRHALENHNSHTGNSRRQLQRNPAGIPDPLFVLGARAGYTIIGATAEQDSGLTLDRPGLEMVTQAVLAGKVDMVLVNSIDRIGQEWDMTQAYIDLLTQHKVKL
ncbi:MAG: recombinase family protein, partial [Candidatus Heritagella sp.]|nr:recombinase family protein [Candidatus Heritagella sp.]